MEQPQTENPFKLTSEDTTAFKRTMPVLFPEAIDLIEKTFEADIQLFSGKKGHTSLVEKLFGLALDPGLRRKAVFGNEEREAIAMLNRSSFLYELRRRVGFHKGGVNDMDIQLDRNFKLLTLDLKNIRAADQAKDSKGNSAGDFVLNLAAGELNRAVIEVSQELGINSEDILVGRYGGDEFYVGLIGDFEIANIEKIKAKIKQYIESKQGMYLTDGKINKVNLELKNNKIAGISIPEDAVKRQIFLSFMQRGMVLDAEQLDKEKELFIDSSGVINQVRLNDYLGRVIAQEIYPKEIATGGFAAQINYLTRLHPELRIPFYLAKHLDKQEGETIVTRQIALLNFVENYTVDPLLDEIIISRFDLLDHLKRGEFSKVFAFEVKLKEINDCLSYTIGDQAVINLWKKEKMLKQLLGEERDKVKIGRFAGTLFFGLKKGQSLLPETEEKIRQTINTGIEDNYKGINFKQMIGLSEIDTSDFDLATDDTVVKGRIGQIFELATENWLENVFRELTANNDSLDKFINLLDKDGVEFDEDIFTLLSARYFTGARWQTRIIKAQEILTRIDTTAMSEVDILKIDLIKGALEKAAAKKNAN